MFPARKIAQGMIPLLVLAWATLAILGGASMPAEHGNITDKAVGTGMVICGITVVLLVGAGARRLRETPFTAGRRVCWRESFRSIRSAAYDRPPAFTPSLEILQVLRT
ncbi:MAG: hypothetical protein WA990_11805 [Rubrobacteraceae bacterium]